MKKIISIVLALGASGALAGDARDIDSVAERYSYAMGAQLGELLKAQGVTGLDAKAFALAIDDVLQGRSLRLSNAEMQQAVAAQQQVLSRQRSERAKQNRNQGREFLAANAQRAGITVLPSGLQYRVLVSGEGPRPTASDTVRVHYHGTKIDGSVFDSSVDRGAPAEFGVNGVIPGFREALLNMRVGDHWQVFVPSGLAYGERGAGADIGPNEALVFELQLLGITD